MYFGKICIFFKLKELLLSKKVISLHYNLTHINMKKVIVTFIVALFVTGVAMAQQPQKAKKEPVKQEQKSTATSTDAKCCKSSTTDAKCTKTASTDDAKCTKSASADAKCCKSGEKKSECSASAQKTSTSSEKKCCSKEAAAPAKK